MDKVLHSSNYENWGTPTKLYNVLDSLFHIDCDIAAEEVNKKCATYISLEQDALSADSDNLWKDMNFCNPPYNKKGTQWQFVKKALEQYEQHGKNTIFLLPSRTDTAGFHDHIYPFASFLFFFRGRLKFELSDGPSQNAAPFPSCLVGIGDHFAFKKVRKELVATLAKAGYKGNVVVTSFLDK